MYKTLDEEVLRTGERLEIGVVEGPDADWLPRLAPFLGHKPDRYRHHIRSSLEGPLDLLDTRFYVGLVNGRLISQIMVVGDRLAGIVGHVFTLPDERRKGACRAIMARQMDDCRDLGYQALGLGTGFESAPYWIYHSFGFRGVAPGNGCMRWFASSEAERVLYASPGCTHVRDGLWSDWGHVHLLALRPCGDDEELPRNVVLGLKTQQSAEGPFLYFQQRREHETGVQAKALVSVSGGTVGWATLAPDSQWFGDHWLAAADTQPMFTDQLSDLLEAFSWPNAPVLTYLSNEPGPKSRAFQRAGFRKTQLLRHWLRSGEANLDVSIWRREAG